MSAARRPRRGAAASPGTDHISAIHVLAAKLGMDDSARRDLMHTLVGKRSCSEMSPAQRARVRTHMDDLVQRQSGCAPAAGHGAARRTTAEERDAAKAAASPRERKVWALWHALHRAGAVDSPDDAALYTWVQRTVQVSAPRFCTAAQLDTCIEALKAWLQRAGAGQAGQADRRSGHVGRA